MIMLDDRWRSTYDAWKLATPPEYQWLGPDPDEPDEPEEDYDAELDWLSLLETYR
jgi:hypothetical protein